MVAVFCRPCGAVQMPDGVVPQLASWDRQGSPGQRRLGAWLQHVDEVAAKWVPSLEPLAVALTVGLPAGVPLDSGGRDLDNYLLPVVQRIGPTQVVAAFARKVRGPSSLALAHATLAHDLTSVGYRTTLTGSSQSAGWKQSLRDGLVAAGVQPAPPGPLSLTAAITTGPGRVWTNLWKPLIDSLGPILGEHPSRPFHPHDDRIVDLALHHHVDPHLGHDVIVNLRWATHNGSVTEGRIT